jgi:hypothetical protein
MRFIRQRTLAVGLALFNGTPGIDCVGQALPEATKRHNCILSKLRVAAVRHAIIDTGVIDPDIIVGSDGLGDELAHVTTVPETDQVFAEPKRSDPDTSLPPRTSRSVGVDTTSDQDVWRGTLDDLVALPLGTHRTPT